MQKARVKKFKRKGFKDFDRITVVFQVDKEFSLTNKYHIIELFEAMKFLGILGEAITGKLWERFKEKGMKGMQDTPY